jgi:chaperonin GroEL
VLLEEGKEIVTELEITEGMKLEKVLSHLISLRIQKNGSFIHNKYILLTDKRITLVQQDLLPILEQIKQNVHF